MTCRYEKIPVVVNKLTTSRFRKLHVILRDNERIILNYCQKVYHDPPADVDTQMPMHNRDNERIILNYCQKVYHDPPADVDTQMPMHNRNVWKTDHYNA